MNNIIVEIEVEPTIIVWTNASNDVVVTFTFTACCGKFCEQFTFIFYQVFKRTEVSVVFNIATAAVMAVDFNQIVSKKEKRKQGNYRNGNQGNDKNLATGAFFS